MPPKRRRTSQINDGRSEDGDSIQSTTPPVKRRRRGAQYDPATICRELYDYVRNYKSEEVGHLLCEAFVRIPKRRSNADYYEVVTQPIDFMKIQSKLKSDEYTEIDQLTADIELLCNNAKAYYKKSTPEHKDANELWEIYLEQKNNLVNAAFGELNQDKDTSSNMDDDKDERESVSTIHEDNEVNENMEEVFGAIYSAKDADREISIPFHLVPSKSTYPEYYQIIKDPIDLKMIATRIQSGKYATMEDLQRDMNLMFRNAKKFNEPESLICNDASILKKVMTSKIQELENKPLTKGRSGRPRRKAPTKWSAVCAALEYPAGEEEEVIAQVDPAAAASEDDGESDTDSSFADEEDPYYLLYASVKNYRNGAGDSLCEPFLRLPSRRHYPDYYEEIQAPMSLINVRKKIKGNGYASLEDLTADLDLIFENAKTYNADESKIFKDAVRLQRVMLTKKKELDGQETYSGSLYNNTYMEDLPPLFPQQLPSFIPQFFKNEMDEDDILPSTPRPTARPKAKTPKTETKRDTDSPTVEGKKKPGRKPVSNEEALRKRLWVLFKTVHDVEDEGRPLITLFKLIPSKKDYPDYYRVISEPIDMNIIERKIVEDKYRSELALINDFELMFNNARHYNEETSQVYKDAEVLEKILKKKVRNLSPLQADLARGIACSGRSIGRKTPGPKTKSLAQTTLEQKLLHLHNTIKDYTDSRGRSLSTPFMRLPTKQEYPNYYEIIKKPIDMQRISQRMTSNNYHNLDDMVADFVVMFDNACNYNEPESQIYKDALTLQRVCLEKKTELTQDDDTNEVPDVRALIQELMMNLFISVYNHQDEEGRCFVDSLAELPELPSFSEPDPQTGARKHLTFDQIKNNLDKNRYRRLDRFQDDIFEVFEHARRISRTDSQVYEDSIELQTFFFKIRDELCKNGDILLSPSLSYTEKHLQTALEEVKREKQPKEQKEDEERQKVVDAEKELEAKTSGDSLDSVQFKDQLYSVGDFVYLEPRDKSLEPHIVSIEKLYKDTNGEWNVKCCWYYRPNETYHLATRKFLEQEVFKSDFYDTNHVSKLQGQCYVMFVKDYFKNKPEGIADNDVYVCESRYSTKHKAFKKIKNWQVPKNDRINIIDRAALLTPARVASVFAEKHPIKKETAFDDGLPIIMDKVRLNVIAESPPDVDESLIYYEQFVAANGAFKLGDSVYVRSANDKTFIQQIDRIWSDRGGNAFFSGPIYLPPTEVEHSPTRIFFKREVFRSNQDTTSLLIAIIGKCSVLSSKDICCCRPTEYGEDDVFVCESKYIEEERSIKKILKNLKRNNLSAKVCDDEIYFFKKPITPKKEPSPLLMQASQEQFVQGIGMDTDSLMTDDNSNMDVSSQFSLEESFIPVPEFVKPPVHRTPTHSGSSKAAGSGKKQKKKHVPSGYIVFAGECRKMIQEENPEMSFGDISRIVGTKWRNLTKVDKEKFEDRAKKLAEEQNAKEAEANKAFNDSLSTYPPQVGSPRQVGQNGQQQQGNIHLMYGPGGYQQMGPMGQYPQMQQMGGMPPYGMAPPPVTVMMGHPQAPMQFQQPNMLPPGQAPNMLGQSMMPPQGPMPGMIPGAPVRYQPPMGGMPPEIAMSEQASMAPPMPPPRPPSPIFTSVPPRTQRLLHSEAYLRYIEGLNVENKVITDWDKNLNAVQDNTPVNPNNRLPTQWLQDSDAIDIHGDATNALWALRDFMLKDAMSIQRTLDPVEILS